MAMAGGVPDLSLIAFFGFLLCTHGATAVQFTFRNNCPDPVWPATLTSGGPTFPTTGFLLPPGTSISFPGVGATWSGRVWGRSRCAATTSASGGAARFSCESGDCGTGQLACNGAGGAPPATLAEFTLAGGGNDFYDVSNVDGFNLPVEIQPAAAAAGGGVRCPSTSCPADINRVCPSELAVRAPAASGDEDAAAAAAVVGCKSACLAFGTDEYCCRGQFGSPATCKPSGYSRVFKAQCPQAYSYAFDDRSSTFTCNGSVDYQVTFCPGSGTTAAAATNAVLPPDGE